MFVFSQNNFRFRAKWSRKCFPDGSEGKEYAYNAEDLGSIPGFGRSPRGGKGYPLQCSGLENSMDCIVHGVAKSQTRLGDFHSFTYSGTKEDPAQPKIK